MRTLKLENGGKITLDGSQIDMNQFENKSELLISLLNLDVELSSDITALDLIHFFYDAKDLIKGVLSEEYEVVRALVSATKLPRQYKHIRIYKAFKIETEVTNDNEEFIYMIPEIELVPAAPGEDGINNIGGLPVVIDEEIELVHNAMSTPIKSKSKLTLMDVMTCVFDDLPALIQEGLILSH